MPSRQRSTYLPRKSEANSQNCASPPHFIDAIVPRAAGRGRAPPLRRKPHLLYLYRCFRYLAARFFYMFSSLFCLPQIRHRRISLCTSLVTLAFPLIFIALNAASIFIASFIFIPEELLKSKVYTWRVIALSAIREETRL